jgi:hypothetical protein
MLPDNQAMQWTSLPVKPFAGAKAAPAATGCCSGRFMP